VGERIRCTDAPEAIQQFVRRVTPSTYSIYMGIDPGRTGAIALICGRDAVSVNIPTIITKVRKSKPIPKKKRIKDGPKSHTVDSNKTSFDYVVIVAIFKALKLLRYRTFVCLEIGLVQNQAHGSGSALVAYKTGFGYGLWPLFLFSKDYNVTEVMPAAWKKVLGLTGKDKAASREMAIKNWSHVDLHLKKDHDRAEALLLAHYLRRIHGIKDQV
jgi:hypothetical protein